MPARLVTTSRSPTPALALMASGCLKSMSLSGVSMLLGSAIRALSGTAK